MRASERIPWGRVTLVAAVTGISIACVTLAATLLVLYARATP